jgi:cytochrome bd ubiquinol oxidase subunit I
VANQTGWVAAEVGRQPWVVYPAVDAKGQFVTGLLTRDGVSEVVTAPMVLGSIIYWVFRHRVSTGGSYG